MPKPVRRSDHNSGRATFDAKLLPHIAKTTLPVADLRAAIAADLAAAGAAHGNRGAGEGAAWTFAVKGEGKVISANLTSRARQAELDTDGDGVADLTLALGPVIKGTALRDVAPFYVFGDFRDQIEFAQLARALNDKVSPLLVLPEGDLTGKSMTFTGVVPIKIRQGCLGGHGHIQSRWHHDRRASHRADHSRRRQGLSGHARAQGR